MHVHAGRWLITLHSVFVPQVPRHGSWHLEQIQLNMDGQSVSTTHSGRQPS